MKDPAILLYTSDFLTGTYFLTFEEKGKFITLICLQQQYGHMSYDTMKQVVGTLSNRLLSLYKRDELGLYYNERTDLEIERRRKYSQRQSQRAQKRWADPDRPGVDAPDIPI